MPQRSPDRTSRLLRPGLLLIVAAAVAVLTLCATTGCVATEASQHRDRMKSRVAADSDVNSDIGVAFGLFRSESRAKSRDD